MSGKSNSKIFWVGTETSSLRRLQSCLEIAPSNLSLDNINSEFLIIVIPYCPERRFSLVLK